MAISSTWPTPSSFGSGQRHEGVCNELQPGRTITGNRIINRSPRAVVRSFRETRTAGYVSTQATPTFTPKLAA